MVIQGIITALSVGMGCGTCCGSGVSAALFGYLTTHAGGMKHSLRAFVSFYLGKILTVAAVCMGSSLLGRALLQEDGSIGTVNVHQIADLCMIAIGIGMILRWIFEKRRKGCEHCHGCAGSSGRLQRIRAFFGKWFRTERREPEVETRKEPGSRVSHFALAAMGAGYGISPCAPLIMMAGYAATLGAGAALLTGCVFAAASAVVPMIVILFLSGFLSSRIAKEIPRYIDIFRLISYVLLIVVFAADL